MISRRNVVLGIPGLMLGSAALTSCGAGSKVTGSDASCDVDAPSSATTVQVLAYSAPALDPFSGAMAAGCSQVSNLTVEHGQVDFSAQLEKAQLSLSQKGNGSYDVIEVYGGTLPDYASKDWLAPLDSFVSASGSRYQVSDIDKRFLDAFTFDDKLYAIPVIANVHVMVYRKDILDELSIEPPTTFAELIAAAKKIQQSKKVQQPLALTYGAQSAMGAVFNNSLNSLGGAWLNGAGDTPVLDSSEAAASVESLASLLPFTDPARLTWDQPEVQSALLNGSAAIGILYSGRAAQFDDPTKSDFAGKFGYAMPPSVKTGGKPWATLNVDGFGVAKNSAAPADLVAQVIAAGTGAEVAKSVGSLVYPARVSVLNDPDLAAKAAYWKAATAALDAGVKTYPKVGFFAAMQKAVTPFIVDAVSGKASVQQSLAKAQQAAEMAIAQDGG